MNADLQAHLDDETPCGWCGHANGWHAPIDGEAYCGHLFGTPDECECPEFLQEPSE